VTVLLPEPHHFTLYKYMHFGHGQISLMTDA